MSNNIESYKIKKINQLQRNIDRSLRLIQTIEGIGQMTGGDVSQLDQMMKGIQSSLTAVATGKEPDTSKQLISNAQVDEIKQWVSKSKEVMTEALKLAQKEKAAGSSVTYPEFKSSELDLGLPDTLVSSVTDSATSESAVPAKFKGATKEGATKEGASKTPTEVSGTDAKEKASTPGASKLASTGSSKDSTGSSKASPASASGSKPAEVSKTTPATTGSKADTKGKTSPSGTGKTSPAGTEKTSPAGTGKTSPARTGKTSPASGSTSSTPAKKDPKAEELARATNMVKSSSRLNTKIKSVEADIKDSKKSADKAKNTALLSALKAHLAYAQAVVTAKGDTKAASVVTAKTAWENAEKASMKAGNKKSTEVKEKYQRWGWWDRH